MFNGPTGQVGGDWKTVDAPPEGAIVIRTLVDQMRFDTTEFSVRAGETVLIHGIGGGVSLACLQLAKLVGATAIGAWLL